MYLSQIFDNEEQLKEERIKYGDDGAYGLTR